MRAASADGQHGTESFPGLTVLLFRGRLVQPWLVGFDGVGDPEFKVEEDELAGVKDARPLGRQHQGAESAGVEAGEDDAGLLVQKLFSDQRHVGLYRVRVVLVILDFRRAQVNRQVSDLGLLQDMDN